jgi:putative flippase GtrA
MVPLVRQPIRALQLSKTRGGGFLAMRLMSWSKIQILAQLARYTLVSALALLVDFSALVTLTEVLHFHYLISAALAFGLGLFTNYFLSVLWVFDGRAMKSRSAEFLSFALLGVIGLGMNEIVLLVLSGWCGLHYALSKFAATALTFAWNFLSRKFLLFNPASGRTAELETAPDPVAPDPVAPDPLRVTLAAAVAVEALPTK